MQKCRTVEDVRFLLGDSLQDCRYESHEEKMGFLNITGSLPNFPPLLPEKEEWKTLGIFLCLILKGLY